MNDESGAEHNQICSGGALGGMLIGAALGASFGPFGLFIGGLLGMFIGIAVEYDIIKGKKKRMKRR